MTQTRSLVLPADELLPGASRIFDADTVAGYLQPMLRTDAVIARLSPSYMEYEPGVSLSLQYRVEVDGARSHVVLRTGDRRRIDDGVRNVKGWSSERAPIDNWAHLLQKDIDITWFPVDPGLPLLQAGPDAICEALLLPTSASFDLLAWVPEHRAVFASGDAVVKYYASTNDAATAVRAMQGAEGLVRSATLRAHRIDCGLVAQFRVDGVALHRSDGLGAAAAAASAMSGLWSNDRRNVDLPIIDAETLLAQCRKPTELVRFALPECSERVAQLTNALASCAPHGLRLGICHGDFNVGQLLLDPLVSPVDDQGTESRFPIDPNRVCVVDLDTLCLAPPAFDLASYAANVMSGRPDDEVLARQFVDEFRNLALPSHMLEGIDWFYAAMLLRRIDRPLRRGKRDWPERVHVLLDAAERATTRLSK